MRSILRSASTAGTKRRLSFASNVKPPVDDIPPPSASTLKRQSIGNVSSAPQRPMQVSVVSDDDFLGGVLGDDGMPKNLILLLVFAGLLLCIAATAILIGLSMFDPLSPANGTNVTRATCRPTVTAALATIGMAMEPAKGHRVLPAAEERSAQSLDDVNIEDSSINLTIGESTTELDENNQSR